MITVHRYSFAGQIQFWMYNLLALFFLGTSFYVGVHAILEHAIDQIPYVLIILILGLFLFFSAQIYSEIVADNNGLLVQFFVFYLRVRWDHLIDIKPTDRRFIPYAMWVHYSSDAYVVSTHSLTPFHRLYGLFQKSSKPSFVFFSDISGFADLFASISNKKLIQKSEKLAV